MSHIFCRTHGEATVIVSFMVICGQAFTEEIIKKIQETVEEKPRICRHLPSLLVCAWLNWRGENGRGRQDKERKCAVSVKDIYVYPLGSEVVENLRDESLSEMEVEEGKQGGDWVSEEFGKGGFGG